MTHNTYNDVMSGQRDANIRFVDLCAMLNQLGFIQSGGRGSHAKFGKPCIPEIIVLQPDGNKAKPYQVKQVRQIIRKYGLRGETL